MPHYFANNHAHCDDAHDVHELGCTRMPADKRYLGNFDSLTDAMIEARKDFWQVTRCDRCEKTATNRTLASPLERAAHGFGALWTRFR
jgi:hypothetical protein